MPADEVTSALALPESSPNELVEKVFALVALRRELCTSFEDLGCENDFPELGAALARLSKPLSDVALLEIEQLEWEHQYAAVECLAWGNADARARALALLRTDEFWPSLAGDIEFSVACSPGPGATWNVLLQRLGDPVLEVMDSHRFDEPAPKGLGPCEFYLETEALLRLNPTPKTERLVADLVANQSFDGGDQSGDFHPLLWSIVDSETKSEVIHAAVAARLGELAARGSDDRHVSSEIPDFELQLAACSIRGFASRLFLDLPEETQRGFWELDAMLHECDPDEPGLWLVRLGDALAEAAGAMTAADFSERPIEARLAFVFLLDTLAELSVKSEVTAESGALPRQVQVAWESMLPLIDSLRPEEIQERFTFSLDPPPGSPSIFLVSAVLADMSRVRGAGFGRYRWHFQKWEPDEELVLDGWLDPEQCRPRIRAISALTEQQLAAMSAVQLLDLASYLRAVDRP